MKVTGMRVVVCCVGVAIAAMAIPSLAGAKLKKKKVRTEVTLSVAEDPADPAGKTHVFDGSLDVEPDRKTCLRRDVTLVGGKPDDPKVLATDSSDKSGNFDLGSHKTKKGDTFQAFAEKKVKKKRKQGKKIVCKPGESEVVSF
jgi:hypothetical protein